MDNDRDWMRLEGWPGQKTEAYQKGICNFLDFAHKDTDPISNVKLFCPCMICVNRYVQDRDTMKAHLIKNGIDPDYDPWTKHGEEELVNLTDSQVDEKEMEDGDGDDDFFMSQEMASLIRDATNVFSQPNGEGEREDEDSNGGNDELPADFNRLTKASKEPLYPGCNTYSKLSFIVTLMHHKVTGRWSNKSFTMLLKTLQRAFNFDYNFPKSYGEAKKYTKDLGLHYEKIHACINHCILFRKKYANADICPKCLEPRWEEGDVNVNDSGPYSESQGTSKSQSRVPRLVLRYLPITPRIQRLYVNKDIAKQMKWHKEKRKDDGIIEHPADGGEWKSFDQTNKDFAADPCNVRLGLAADGFHPGQGYGRGYSIWPMFVVPYNLPSVMFMKDSFRFLSLLIPGSVQPGNNIDEFLEPLVEELQQLWETGVETYDSHNRTMFNMKAMLLWTINDFPAYASLSGYSTAGKLACPICHSETCYLRLKHGHKQCFQGHRRFLEADHQFRMDRKSFNGERERRPPPTPLSGDDILELFHGIPNAKFGRTPARKRKRDERYLVGQWKKKSIFFELPYWRELKIRHNLDIMHISKNIVDNVLRTTLDIPGKTKDNLNSRLDLIELNMHKNLHPKKVGDKYFIPRAQYQLTTSERKQVLEFLSKVKVPDNYASNIARCASLGDGKIVDMKSHDCHVFMQDLLIPTFRNILPKPVFEPLAELSLFYKKICSKTLTMDELKEWEKRSAVILCKLEKIFVPSFFDVMVHLTVHLAREAMLGGPVQGRWMFRFERGIRELKSYVRNKARPEGSIVEGYIMNECLTFCSRYLKGTDTKFNTVDRNDVDEQQHQTFQLSAFKKRGRPLGKRTIRKLTEMEWKQAQSYIIKNCPEVQPFMEEHASSDEAHNQFVDWFKSHIWKLHIENDPRATKELLSLSRGPSKTVTTYKGYFVNGYRFHTLKQQKRKKTQNSGVVVKGDEESGQLDYFGVLKEVVELEYDAPRIGDRDPIVVLFRCTWFDVYKTGTGIKRDKYGVMINAKRFLGTDEPFVLTSQVRQVYYTKVHNQPDWRTCIYTTPRNMSNVILIDDNDCEDENELDDLYDDFEVPNMVEEDLEELELLPRADVPPIIVNVDSVTSVMEDDDSEQEENEELEEEEEDSEEEFDDDVLTSLYDFDQSGE